MSIKSYTLADGSTATVTATENGVPFNEGMQALTKAIKARVAVRDGSGTGASNTFRVISNLDSNMMIVNDLTFTFEYTGDLPYFLVMRCDSFDYIPIASSTTSILQNYPFGFTFIKTSDTNWSVTLNYHGNEVDHGAMFTVLIADVDNHYTFSSDALNSITTCSGCLYFHINLNDE